MLVLIKNKLDPWNRKTQEKGVISHDIYKKEAGKKMGRSASTGFFEDTKRVISDLLTSCCCTQSIYHHD